MPDPTDRGTPSGSGPLREPSQEQVEDPAARDPDDQGVIRRQSGEGVNAD